MFTTSPANQPLYGLAVLHWQQTLDACRESCSFQEQTLSTGGTEYLSTGSYLTISRLCIRASGPGFGWPRRPGSSESTLRLDLLRNQKQATDWQGLQRRCTPALPGGAPDCRHLSLISSHLFSAMVTLSGHCPLYRGGMGWIRLCRSTLPRFGLPTIRESRGFTSMTVARHSL